MKHLQLALLIAALAAAPAYADKDLLGRDIPAPKKHQQEPPPVLPGLAGEVSNDAPQNSTEADAAASKQAAPAGDAAMFEAKDQPARPKLAPADQPDAAADHHKKPEGQ